MTRRFQRIGAIFLLSTLTGCPAETQNPGTNPNLVRRQVEEQTTARQNDRSRCDVTVDRRTASELDTNNDGRPDVRRVYQLVGERPNLRSVLICREVDLNHDGVKDVFRFYDAEGKSVREEADHDFDGRIDIITYFEAGAVVRSEEDTNGDGQVDKRTYFGEKGPIRCEREVGESNGDPKFTPNYWEFYDDDGHITRIGQDYDGDGRADRWDRVDRVTPVRAENQGALTVGDGGAGDGGASGASAEADGGAS